EDKNDKEICMKLLGMSREEYEDARWQGTRHCYDCRKEISMCCDNGKTIGPYRFYGKAFPWEDDSKWDSDWITDAKEMIDHFDNRCPMMDELGEDVNNDPVWKEFYGVPDV